MNDYEYRALLDLIMCSDPWPVDDGNQIVVIKYADKEAEKRGFDTWVDAYHFFDKPATKEANLPDN